MDQTAAMRVVEYIAVYGRHHRAVVLHPDMVDRIVDEMEQQTGRRLESAPGARNQIMGKAIITSEDIRPDDVFMADPEERIYA